MYPHHKDRAKVIAVAREGRNQFAEQMARERQESAALNATGDAYPGYGGPEGDQTRKPPRRPKFQTKTSLSALLYYLNSYLFDSKPQHTRPGASDTGLGETGP